ncbi:MAG: hypothetical protein CMD12_00390 [Flavobacteriales bacterium]|nr:hypothetical protein [Flavobacteriales bacterium]
MFRGMKGYDCYNEPFNPILFENLPNNHFKKTWDEFIKLWDEDYVNFKSSFCTISPEEELLGELTNEQLKYLLYLSKNPSIIDFSRIGFKVEDILNRFPDTAILFLFRSPIAFASSHIINSENNKFLRQAYSKRFFFSSFIKFDSWGMESIIKNNKFKNYIDLLNISPRKKLNKLKSYELLILYWLVRRRLANNIKRNDKNNRVYIGVYERILENNCNEFSDAISALGIKISDLKTSHLRPFRLGHKPDSTLWELACRNVGFTNLELEEYIYYFK